ncbi:hypothetical protein EV426DRAFT_585794 [Tirmania nivea]|nr:hypothetical protein EV426DRAFT_585794 [Tirmania nivea]
MSGSSEARLYSFTPETLAALKKFRLGTSRASKPQAVIYEINKKTQEIHPSPSEGSDTPTIYTDLSTLASELPPHSPRFVLLSHPITLKSSGRETAPYVLLYYLPPTANNELRMLYAGAKELMRATAGVGKVLEVNDEEEVEGVKEVLEG